MRRAFNYRVRFRGDEQADLLRPVQAHRQLFRRHRTRLSERPAARAGELEILETVRDKVPPEVFTTPYTNPVGGNPEAVRSNLREATAPAQGGGLRGPRQQAGQRQDRRAAHGRSCWSTIRASSASCCSTSPSLERLGIDVSVRTVDDAQYENRLRQWDFDMIIDVWGQVAVARQRAARVTGARRPPTSPARAIYVGIKNPGGRCADRARDLRQGPRRPGRRHQGARPRAAVEPSTSCRNGPTARRAPRAGTASAGPSTMPKYGMPAFPTIWWWDAAKAAKTGIALVSRTSRRMR